jgi:hypothetical protein
MFPSPLSSIPASKETFLPGFIIYFSPEIEISLLPDGLLGLWSYLKRSVTHYRKEFSQKSRASFISHVAQKAGLSNLKYFAPSHHEYYLTERENAKLVIMYSTGTKRTYPAYSFSKFSERMS